MWAPTLDDLIAVAAAELGERPESVRAVVKVGLAESALASPFAGFGEFEAYPSLAAKAAVLVEHVARNHPLPDANKRTAFVLTVAFLARNGVRWRDPDVELDAGMVERIAAGGAQHDEIVAWVLDRTGG